MTKLKSKQMRTLSLEEMEKVNGGQEQEMLCNMSIGMGAIIGGIVAGPAGFLVAALFMKAYGTECN